MAALSRYNVSGQEVETSAGVLKNKLGITNQKLLGDLETNLLNDTYAYFLNLLEQNQILFDLPLLFKIHSYFLGTLYGWAGKIRTVDISKNGVLFTSAQYIKTALKEFEKVLQANTIQSKDTKQKIAEKMAIIHCEFNAIHPFREGNGRTIRLFLDLMTFRHGYLFIDYAKSSQKNYIKACVAGMRKEYKPMTKIIYRGLKKK